MPKHSQVFLVDKNIVRRMISYADIGPGDVVLEIGPGMGIITKELLKKAKKIIAVEIDRDLAWKLKKKLDVDNLDIIAGDILDYELPKFDKVVANVPFEISSPIIFRIFKYKWKKAILIFQKEFAQRFFAKPGERNYSRLTVAVNYYCAPRVLEKISRSRFRPKPKIDALLIELIPKERKENIENGFWELVRKLFEHKKKTVRVALKDAGIKAALPKELEKKRVFQCGLEDFKNLYKLLNNV